MRYKAVFFDRDNTLLHRDPDLRRRNGEMIAGWKGGAFRWPEYEEMMVLFDRAGYPRDGNQSVEEEQQFWRRYYRELLLWTGVTEELNARAELLHQATWLKGLVLYPETLGVLEWFKARGFQMGVISDTSISLPLTLEAAGIGDYFGCAVCSDAVGVSKPDPLIYRTALETLGAEPEESLYVDDYDVEADGARAIGMTAFHLDRSRPGDGRWRIGSLKELTEFVEKQG